MHDPDREQGDQGDDQGNRLDTIERRLARLERATPPLWWRVATDLVRVFLGALALKCG